MEIHKVQINELISPDYNPRTITSEELEKLKDSLEEFGYISPLIVNKHNNHIVGGNQRYLCLKEMGYTEIDVIYIDEPDIQREKALNIRLNNLSGEWDTGKLESIFNEFESTGFNSDITGFTNSEITGFNNIERANDEYSIISDDYEEPDDFPVTVKYGDIYQLGKHRLMCGDSTKKEDVKQLMNGEKADISFTSPPYNAGFGANLTKDNGRSKYLHNDDNKSADEYLQFLNNYLSNVSKHATYNFCNIQYLANNKEPLINFIHDNLSSLADIIIWDKGHSQPQLAENVLNSEYEFVLCFSEKGNRAIGTNQFHGTLKNIVHISNVRTKEYSDIHNATFPIEFAEHFIKNFSTTSVLDVFGGTGTSMIVAEQLHKQCYMMELDPYYCQVIINRWEEFTGEKAVKINQ